MNAPDILAWDRRHVWHPYASLSNPPPVFPAASARGTHITLADGTKLVDAVSSWWCVAHGHNHPKIVEAIQRQAEKMSHVMFGGFTHEPAVELSRRICQITPPGLDRVFFADSGSIAVEVASKMAVQFQRAAGKPRRTKLVALKGGYHGDTCGAMALSDPDGMHELYSGIMPRHFFAEQPKSPFGARWLASDFDSMLRLVEKHGGEIAAMICEPVFQAANAMWFYNPEYLRRMRKLCDETGILLVFDEIAAGFYRTGPLWAHEHAGAGAATPDIMCVGKALTGGSISLAATIASGRVAETISAGRPSAFMHGPTFMANPVACAAGCASLELFADGAYAADVSRIEQNFRAGLAGLAALDGVKSVRVLGAVGVVELCAMPRTEDIRRVILETGVWLRPFGHFVYSIPPLCTTDAELSLICEAIGEVAKLPPGPPPEDPDFHE